MVRIFITEDFGDILFYSELLAVTIQTKYTTKKKNQGKGTIKLRYFPIAFNGLFAVLRLIQGVTAECF